VQVFALVADVGPIPAVDAALAGAVAVALEKDILGVGRDVTAPAVIADAGIIDPFAIFEFGDVGSMFLPWDISEDFAVRSDKDGADVVGSVAGVVGGFLAGDDIIAKPSGRVVELTCGIFDFFGVLGNSGAFEGSSRRTRFVPLGLVCSEGLFGIID